jgi:hypothetical protein
MFKVELINLSGVSRALAKQIRSETDRLGNELFAEIRERTPVDTGVAKKGWRKKSTSKGFVIENNVPYIGVLDDGRRMTPKGMRGSKQAPKGIVTPSLKSIKGKN